MEFLKTSNYNLLKDRYYYYNNGIFRLEYNKNQWYLYNYNKKTYDTVGDIQTFIDTNKNILEQSKLMEDKIEHFVERLNQILGEVTFCTTFIFGWNICNSKIKLKIIIDKFSDIDSKSITVQYTHNNTYIHNNISCEELEKFVNNNIDDILHKDPINIKNVDNNLNKDLNKDLNDNINNVKSKVDINILKKKLFIKLSKAKKISYQSCLPYDEDKQKLEKLYGIDLDL
jgi:hypothetical protein